MLAQKTGLELIRYFPLWKGGIPQFYSPPLIDPPKPVFEAEIKKYLPMHQKMPALQRITGRQRIINAH